MTLSSPYRQMPWTPRHIASKMFRAMEDYREQVGRRLLALREDRNMSQEEAAHLVGVSVKTWHNWESGKRSPYESNWAKIADAFGVDVRFIRGKTPDPLALEQAAEVDVSEIGELKAQVRMLTEQIEAMRLELAGNVLEVLTRLDAIQPQQPAARRRRTA